MTILVTGATGHLGANLVRTLLERGERVRVLVRSSSKLAALSGLDVEILEGDLNDEPSLRRAVSGVERLFHTAAMVSIRDGDREALMQTNVEGTRQLMDAALQAGVKRVVHTSSFGAVATRSGQRSDEGHYLDPAEPVNDYERSKALSEDAVRGAAERGLVVTIVNPSAIVGPFDFGPSLVGRTIVDFGNGKMKAYVAGSFDWVPMRDVVSGHLLAMEKGAPGERYLLTGEVHTIDQIMDWLASYTGRARPAFAIPAAAMQKVAIVKDWIERRYFPHVTPRFNYHSIRLLQSDKRGNNERAQKELGLAPTPVSEAFREAVEWFLKTGRIQPA